MVAVSKWERECQLDRQEGRQTDRQASRDREGDREGVIPAGKEAIQARREKGFEEYRE